MNTVRSSDPTSEKTATIGRESRGYPSWAAGPARRGSGPQSDRYRLADARAVLNRYGITAVAAQEGGPEEIRTRLENLVRGRFPDADGSCVFWTAAEEDACLGSDGQLHGPLCVHVYGPGVVGAATAAFELAGLVVAPGASGDMLLVGGPSAHDHQDDLYGDPPVGALGRERSER